MTRAAVVPDATAPVARGGTRKKIRHGMRYGGAGCAGGGSWGGVVRAAAVRLTTNARLRFAALSSVGIRCVGSAYARNKHGGQQLVRASASGAIQVP